MKDRPILFSGPMVRAILEGRKTQTRRVANVEDCHVPGKITPKGYHVPRSPQEHVSYCPYGKPGDRLWVRETFVLECDVEGEAPPFSDGRPINRFDTEHSNISWQQPHYRATDPTPELDMGDGDEPCCKWSPSIFMPRWASRITLEIAKVRVERLQEISHQDALAEGCPGHDWVESSPYIAEPHTDAGELPAEEYRHLWDKINAKRGFGWEKNPWVWVVEFKSTRR